MLTRCRSEGQGVVSIEDRTGCVRRGFMWTLQPAGALCPAPPDENKAGGTVKEQP